MLHLVVFVCIVLVCSIIYVILHFLCCIPNIVVAAVTQFGTQGSFKFNNFSSQIWNLLQKQSDEVAYRNKNVSTLVKWTYLYFWPHPSSPSRRLACVCHTFHYMKRLIETIFVHRFSHGTMPLRTIVRVRTWLPVKRRASDNMLTSFTMCGRFFLVPCQLLWYWF